jgi:hypothetical protein
LRGFGIGSCGLYKNDRFVAAEKPDTHNDPPNPDYQ